MPRESPHESKRQADFFNNNGSAFAGLGVHLGYLSKANVRAVVGSMRGRLGGATS